MATQSTFGGNGVNRQFDITFPYNNTSEIRVEVDGVPASFTFASASALLLETPPAVGTRIRVYRKTGFDTPAVDFQDGAVLTENDLDTSAGQLFRRIQELSDGADDLTPRTLRLPSGFTIGELTAIPNRVLGFNTSGQFGLLDGSQFKGDPGGNIGAIGLFSAASNMSIDPSVTSVRTSGHTVTGVGIADYAYDPTVNAAYVILNPRSSFRTTNGRGFRLAVAIANASMFGALGDNTTDNSPAFAAYRQWLSQRNGYETAAAMNFENGIYKYTESLVFTLATGSQIQLNAEGRATLNYDGPVGSWAVDVDYATGRTANFVTFSTRNITIAALNPAKLRKLNGMRIRGVVGAKYVQTEFNFFDIAVTLYDDSNLNVFDTCMWRENNYGFKSLGNQVANNNIFLAPQFRYHQKTAFDSTGTGGNLLIGGDFEPYNASPVIIADQLKMMGPVRFERNVPNGSTGIVVLNGSVIDIDAHADGATIPLPTVEVRGYGNTVKVIGTGGSAVTIKSTARDNKVDVSNFTTLLTNNGAIYTIEPRADGTADPSNTVVHYNSEQGNGPQIVEAYAAALVPTDLNAWTKTDVTITTLANGTQRVTTSGPNPSLTYTLPAGSYKDIQVSVSSTSSNAVSQGLMSFSGGPSGADTAFTLGNGFPGHTGRKIIATMRDVTFVNPTATIKPLGAATGTYFDVTNIRTRAGTRP